MMEIVIVGQPDDPERMKKLCPFGAIEVQDGTVLINSACRFCRVCVKKEPAVFALREDEPAVKTSVLTEFSGVAVYLEQVEGAIHPVSLELVGKGRYLADRAGQKLYGILIGNIESRNAEELLHYPIDELHLYCHPLLSRYTAEPYAALFEDFITLVKPSAVLVGGTVIGRSLAPRVAAHFKTGLTADCTMLDISPEGQLDQIRPAFGGDIMAFIHTANSRPQFATVRYKVFDPPARSAEKRGRVVCHEVAEGSFTSGIRVIESKPKPAVSGIEDASVIVAIGKGVKKKSDLDLIEGLASVLKAQIAGTRPMIESGILDPRRQIGLSGRTVKPKLIITLGVSGSVQFVAGMKSSERIIAVNTDRNAPIFNVAHIGIVGDLYEVIPRLLHLIETRETVDAL